MLQKRKEEAGGIARVAAPDIEHLVIAALLREIGGVNRQVVPGQTCPPAGQVLFRAGDPGAKEDAPEE